MKKFLCVLCVLCGSVLSSSALDRHAFTFTDYNLTITLDPPKSGLTAEGSVTLRNDTTEPQKVAVLQISSSLDWRSITVGGKRVQFVSQPYISDIDHTGSLNEAIVTLPAAVAPKGTVEVEFQYSGTIRQDAYRLTAAGVPEKTALASDWDRIGDPFTALRGVGYVTWYPISTEAASLTFGSQLFDEIGAWKQRETEATMDVTILRAVDAAKREVVGTLNVFDRRPLGFSTPAFATGEYQHLKRSGMPADHPNVDIDYLAGRQQLAEDYARAITDLAPFVTEWFGAPKQAVHVVELPWAVAAPWESGPMLLTPLEQESHSKLELALVHQLTHAAFESPRQWIYEGLAHFAQVLDRERVDGRKDAIAYMQAQSDLLLTAQQPDVPNAPGRKEPAEARRQQPLATTTDELFYRTKAMWVWWMLRDMVGDAPLQRALHAYKADDDREPSYMQRLIEAESKRKLEWFFDDWIYRDRGLPDFHVDSAYPRATLAGGYILTIAVEDRGDAGAEVPVTVETAHGAVTRRLEVHAHDKAFVRIEVPEAPRRVIVNDGSVPEVLRKDNVFEVKLPGS
ncbi:MAG: hypothetical protein LAN37_03555 [Acidobacteriia bacterium]|nr:hypothetical protein [Terriglobia bacterium]